MKVVCSKCGSEGSSKCPVLRTIFSTPKTDRESSFWFGLGYELEEVKEGTGWKPGTQQLKVTMVIGPELTEEDAMKNFIRRMKSVPDDQLDSYVCKHSYEHTMDCVFCSFKLEVTDASTH